MTISKNGGVNRRDVLKLGTALAVSPLLAGTARAQSAPITLVNWGGDSLKGMTDAFAAPFEKATGIKVQVDTSGPSAGKIRAMVQSGKVTWDVCDGTVGYCLELGPAGLLEEIDYAIVPKTATLDSFAFKWGVGSYAYSSVLAFDKEKFKDKAPSNWADFWNLKDFPGRRLLRADLPTMLEAALMADGVDPAKLYPLDTKRGFEKLREIKENTIFWKTAAESAQLLRNGEVVMGNIWSTRAAPLSMEPNSKIGFTWNQGILQSAVWIVPKGNPAGREAVMKLIAFMQQPEPAIALSRVLYCGPMSPAAAAALPADLRPLVPTAPENVKVQVPMDGMWYAENYQKELPKYLDLIAS
ncbi:MAG TPA: ABC transporter substrate-binding protein [Bordetella sp.]